MKNIVFFLLLTSSLFSQQGNEKKFIVSSNYEFVYLESYVNFGLKYQFKQSEIGLLYGFRTEVTSQKEYYFATDYYYHFAGLSSLSSKRTWYINGGFKYMNSLRELFTNTKKDLLIFNFKIGKEFNLSKRFGIDSYVGFNQIISSRLEPPLIYTGVNDTSTGVLIGLGVFYKL